MYIRQYFALYIYRKRDGGRDSLEQSQPLKLLTQLYWDSYKDCLAAVLTGASPHAAALGPHCSLHTGKTKMRKIKSKACPKTKFWGSLNIMTDFLSHLAPRSDRRGSTARQRGVSVEGLSSKHTELIKPATLCHSGHWQVCVIFELRVKRRRVWRLASVLCGALHKSRSVLNNARRWTLLRLFIKIKGISTDEW